MSFNLPDNIVLPTSPERHNIVIAEIVIFAAILPTQLVVRYIQIRSHAGARGAKNPLRCLLRAWLNFVVIFAQTRIVGFALYLGAKNPSKGVVIAEVLLQVVGLSPLLLELSFTLLRCGRAGSSDEETTKYSKVLERMLQYTRVPIVFAVILIIIAGSILNLSLLEAGAVVILATFIYIGCIAIFIVTRYGERLVENVQLGLWMAIASLPLYAVRVIYLMLVEFGDAKFDPVVGDPRYFIGLGFAMEVGIVVLLVIAGIAVAPLRSGTEPDSILPMAKPVSSGGVGN